MSVSLIIKGLTNELKFDHSKIPKQRLTEYTATNKFVFTVGELGPIDYILGEVVGNQHVVSPALPIGIGMNFTPIYSKENTFTCTICMVTDSNLLHPQMPTNYTISNSSLIFSITIISQSTN